MSDPVHPLPVPLDYEVITRRPLWRRHGLRWLKWTLLAVTLYYVGRHLAGNFRKIDLRDVHVRPLPLLGAAAAVLSIYVLQMVCYRFLLASYTRRLPWRAMAAVAWVPILGKYVPGKVVAITHAVSLLRRFGVGTAAALSVVLVQDGLAQIAGLMLGSRLLLLPAMQERVQIGWAVCLAVIVGGLVVLYPPIYTGLINLALKLLGREKLPRAPKLREYALPATTAFAQQILCGTAVWLMSRAFGAEPPARDLPMFVSVASLAMTISYLALFAPGGLGIREGIFAIGLTPFIGAANATLVTVAMRLLYTLTEIALTFVGYAALRSVARSSVLPTGSPSGSPPT